MRSYQFNLQANAIQDLNAIGNHVRILEATNDVFISLDNQPFFKLKAGQGITDNTSFETIRLKSLVVQNVLLVAGVGTFHDSSESVSITTTTTIEAANTYKPVADILVNATSTAALVGANANRKLLTITNPVTNTGSFRLGVPLNVGAGRGDRLDVGESISLALTGALSAYNEGATNESLIVSELENI